MEVLHQYCLILINYQEETHIICIDSDGEYYLLQEITEKSHKVGVKIEGWWEIVREKGGKRERGVGKEEGWNGGERERERIEN